MGAARSEVFSGPISEVSFLQADLFGVSLSDAAVVLVNVGNMRKLDTVSRLRDYLLTALPDRCIVATIMKPVAEAGCHHLVPLEDFVLPMSWGFAQVFLSEMRRRGMDVPPTATGTDTFRGSAKVTGAIGEHTAGVLGST